MRRFALLLSLCAGPAAAGPWEAMTGPEVLEALTGRTLRYNADTIQDFRPSGRTLYTHKGQESWGYWVVRDAQYCSQWPPSDLWACYDMAQSAEGLRFIGASGDITDGVYAD